VTLPPAVRRAVESALEDRPGRPAAVEDVTPVSGGCISPVARLLTTSGESWFLKWGGPDLPDALLTAEARGLRQLAATRSVRVPEVVAEAAPGETPWLLMEWLEPGEATSASWERLGRELAALHRNSATEFGADAPNFIGSLPQSNGPSTSWPEFWRDCRLEPQLRRARGAGLLGEEDNRRFQRLLSRLEELLAPAADEAPSLLHGDLWSGNVHMMEGGQPAVVDPSAYHGHREVDLAMAELFGGFGSGFRESYEESWPLAAGYAPVRRAVYQLYYLLVHVNLFGPSYLGRTRGALSAAGF
jgi:fructosamine-3-kinase